MAKPTKKTPQQWLSAIKKDASVLSDAPGELMTPEFCLDAVKKNGDALQYVPEKLKTPELCMAAIQECGWALRYLPEELKTPAFYLPVMEYRGWTFEYVPEEHKTPAICLAAVANPYGGNPLEYVPEGLKTLELCLIAVQATSSALEYVPEALKTPELCLAAVQASCLALEHVPEALKTLELCLAAVQEGDYALDYVPESLKKEVRRLAAIQNDGQSENKSGNILEISVHGVDTEIFVGQLKGVSMEDVEDIRYGEFDDELPDASYSMIFEDAYLGSTAYSVEVSINEETVYEMQMPDGGAMLDIDDIFTTESVAAEFYFDKKNPNTHDEVVGKLDPKQITYVHCQDSRVLFKWSLDDFEGEFDKNLVKFTLTGGGYLDWLGEHKERIVGNFYIERCLSECFYDGIRMDGRVTDSDPQDEETFYYDKGWNKDTPILYMRKTGSTTQDTPAAPVTLTLAYPVTGLNVVFTGKGPMPRKELADLLKAAGATVQSDVNDKTELLILEDANSTSSKAKAARAQGIKIIQYSDILGA